MDNSYIPKTQKGLFGNIWAWVIGIVLIVGSVLLIGGVTGWITAPWKGKLEQRQQVNSGNYRIVAYNQFFDECASITTDEQNLQAFYRQLQTATGDDKIRIETNITANIVDVNQAINQYNADAQKSGTVGQFRASSVFQCVGTSP